MEKKRKIFRKLLNLPYTYRFSIVRYTIYANIIYISYCFINPINRITSFYKSGLNRFFSELIDTPEISKSSNNLIEQTFKNKDLINLQLKQLKAALKSESVIAESKVFGKKWIGNIVKSQSFIYFSKSYFTKIFKTPDVIQVASNLMENIVTEKSVIDSWADLFKKGCLDFPQTYDALINQLNKAGIDALQEDSVKIKIGEAGYEIINSKDFIDSIKKSSFSFY